MNIVRITGLFVLAILFLLNIYYLIYDPGGYQLILERYLSADHHIIDPLLIYSKIQISFFAGSCIVWTGTNPSLYRNTVLADGVHKVAFCFVLLLCICYGVNLLFENMDILYEEGQLFESLTVIFALLSSVFFLMSMKHAKSILVKVILLALSICFFIFGMEEISWGQQIFHWQVTGKWSEINYQKESNFHNLFNPYFPILYPIFNGVVAVFMLSVKKIRVSLGRYIHFRELLLLLPQKEAIVYSFIFFCLVLQSGFYHTELTEEIFSTVCLAYAVKQLMMSRQCAE